MHMPSAHLHVPQSGLIMTNFDEQKYIAWRLPTRLAYIVDQSLPHTDSDDACRTHEIARAMVDRGFEVLVFSRPGRPWDMDGFVPNLHVDLDTTIEGVRYITLPGMTARPVDGRQSLRFAERVLHEAISVFRPALIVVTSNWQNAEPAANVAERLDLPFVYEVRNRPQHRGGWLANHSLTDREAAAKEVSIARRAMAVMAMTDVIRQDFLALGVTSDSIKVLPNGVRVSPPQVPIRRKSEFGCTAKHLLGFVYHPEDEGGGEQLIRLIAELRSGGTDVAALIVSVDASGVPAQQVSLLQQSAMLSDAEKLDIKEHVMFAPPTTREMAGVYYAGCDALIFSSRSLTQCELAEPLEPYVVAAYGVPQFIAGVAALSAVVEDTQATKFREGDLSDLVQKLQIQLRDDKLLKGPRKDAYWRTRIDPLVAVMLPLAQKFKEQESARRSGAATLGRRIPPFDLKSIPETIFTPERGLAVAGIGPCNEQRFATAPFTALTRANLFSHLALGNPGIFLIDWAGMRRDFGNGLYEEWADLWMVSNMRLNRQLMDASRIAVNRGWRLIVLGPISEAAAPMFRTVSSVFEVVSPDEEVMA